MASSAPNGDIAQGMITSYAPNKDFKAPDHADDDKAEEETYQLDDLRKRDTGDGSETWQGDTKSRLNKSGGVTHRVGKDMRIAAHKKGAKIRAKNDFVVVQDGKIIMSRPPRIRPIDPIPNDND